MSETEIPERAFVIAERLKGRQESESTIRAALAEFELTEKQIKAVLKKAEGEGDFQVIEGLRRGAFSTGRSRTPHYRTFFRGKINLWDTVVETGIRMGLVLITMILMTVFAYIIISSRQ